MSWTHREHARLGLTALATAVVTHTSSHRWWTYRGHAQTGLTASCHRTGLTDIKPQAADNQGESPRGSYSNKPPQRSYRTLGQPRACPNGSYSVTPPAVDKKSMPERVLQCHATVVVLLTPSHRWWTHGEHAHQGLTATCHRSGLTGFLATCGGIAESRPKGSYSVTPLQWSTRPTVPNGGQLCKKHPHIHAKPKPLE